MCVSSMNTTNRVWATRELAGAPAFQVMAAESLRGRPAQQHKGPRVVQGVLESSGAVTTTCDSIRMPHGHWLMVSGEPQTEGGNKNKGLQAADKSS
jgi:hypothetical protein